MLFSAGDDNRSALAISTAVIRRYIRLSSAREAISMVPISRVPAPLFVMVALAIGVAVGSAVSESEERSSNRMLVPAGMSAVQFSTPHAGRSLMRQRNVES